MAAALRYRAQAPIVDGLVKELGFDGTSLDKLVAGATAEAQAAEPPAIGVRVKPSPKKPAENDGGAAFR